jgi:hypothetical protein
MADYFTKHGFGARIWYKFFTYGEISSFKDVYEIIVAGNVDSHEHFIEKYNDAMHTMHYLASIMNGDQQVLIRHAKKLINISGATVNETQILCKKLKSPIDAKMKLINEILQQAIENLQMVVFTLFYNAASKIVMAKGHDGASLDQNYMTANNVLHFLHDKLTMIEARIAAHHDQGHAPGPH